MASALTLSAGVPAELVADSFPETGGLPTPICSPASACTSSPVAIDDKYTARSGRIYLSGVQALVRLLIVQRVRDEAHGLDTAGFCSGYRGSPLGGMDRALAGARPQLGAHGIRFVPGINEEMAATAVWGTQQVHMMGPAAHTGVFALWYGKGPGVDRCIDVFKHMNHAGTARYGGVLLVAGDDHGAYSSTLPHQSDHVFSAAMIPVLYPCNVAEYLELGLHGWAMSRFSGCAVGFKAIADTVESSASVDADPFAVRTRLPSEIKLPEGGLNARLSRDPLGVQARHQEALMHDYKIYAAMAYARENHLNRVTLNSTHARLGIVASGKSYQDVLEALQELGVSEAMAEAAGVRVFKVAMPWPLEPEGIRAFATGLEEILVVEEKRQMVEYQLKEQLYNWRADVRPRVIGKFDERGEWDIHNPRGRGDWLLSAKGDFSVAQIARVIAARLVRMQPPAAVRQHIRARLDLLDAKEASLAPASMIAARPPYYCAGCPHNASTRTPEGGVALAGIGCHVMATSIFPESNRLVTQMGGEGAPWIGAAPFSTREHVFANLGDGTYYHSGLLSIRAAVAANRCYAVNITYKILFNDAVAMTGGQPIDGPLGPVDVARQVAAEGVERIALVSDVPSRYRSEVDLPLGTSVHERGELDAVQRELRQVPGVSVLIYDQICAAEKRRRRKRNLLAEASERLYINEMVCEGCGDCGQQSNCTALVPVDTLLGRKRAIDQSACNQDWTCVDGLCPSFVSVSGTRLRRPDALPAAAGPLPPLPVLPALAKPYNVLITGIGGTGVITVGALLGMAAHLEGKGVSVLDMTGMSQKNGAVMSHVRFATGPGDIKAQRVATGEADLVLGCDLLTAASPEALAKTRPGRTIAIINGHEQPTGDFVRAPDWRFPGAEARAAVSEAVSGRVTFVDASRLATILMGDAIAANLFLLGVAFQRGTIPVSRDALYRAMELNAVSVSASQRAFEWGRRAAVDLGSVEALCRPASQPVVAPPDTLETVEQQRRRFADFLAQYQDQAYAAAYSAFLDQVRDAERTAGLGGALHRAVIPNLFKLMAYKDEYEVARLHAHPAFKAQLDDQFEPGYRLDYHLAPPLLARRGPDGRPRKIRFGPWLGTAFRLLARCKRLRGTACDPFGYSDERRQERALINEYRQCVAGLLPRLTPGNQDIAVVMAQLPQNVRGYGMVKAASVRTMREQLVALEARFAAASLRRTA